MMEAIDECRKCTVRGDLSACALTKCSKHHTWYADQLRAEVERLKAEREIDDIDRETGRRWRENSSLEEWFQITAEEINRLQAELDAATKWRPIETAPRDGTDMIIRDDIRAFVARWSNYGLADSKGWLVDEWASGDYNDWMLVENPTHWLPLPTTTEGEEG